MMTLPPQVSEVARLGSRSKRFITQPSEVGEVVSFGVKVEENDHLIQTGF